MGDASKFESRYLIINHQKSNSKTSTLISNLIVRKSNNDEHGQVSFVCKRRVRGTSRTRGVPE